MAAIVLHQCSCSHIQACLLDSNHACTRHSFGKDIHTRLAALSSNFQGSCLVWSPENRKCKYPKLVSSVGATATVESSMANDQTMAAIAAEEAMVLARVAARAARDAAALASGCRKEVNGFPSQTDLLGSVQITKDIRQRSLFYNLARSGPTSSQAQHSADRSLMVTVTEVNTPDVDNLQSSSPRDTTDDAYIRKGERVVAKSNRRAERMSQRQRALAKVLRIKAEVAELATTPVCHSPLKKPLRPSFPSDNVQSFLDQVVSREAELLTAVEEVELAHGIQDLLSLEEVERKLKDRIGRAPSLSEWARAVGMEPRVLTARLQKGRGCKARMMHSNMRLVISVAKKYSGKGMALQDLVQEGRVGLIKGCERFDPDKGFRFATYAYWWIMHFITRALSKHASPIRMPVNTYEVFMNIVEVRTMLYQEYGRPPQDYEIADMLGTSAERVKMITRAVKISRSINRHFGRDKNLILDMIPDKSLKSPETMISRKLLRQDLEQVLMTLTSREKDVIKLRYGLQDGNPSTLAEIGQGFGITRERIRQIEVTAMRKLRQPHRNGILREYLEEF